MGLREAALSAGQPCCHVPLPLREKGNAPSSCLEGFAFLSRLFHELKLMGLLFRRASGCPQATALCGAFFAISLSVLAFYRCFRFPKKTAPAPFRLILCAGRPWRHVPLPGPVASGQLKDKKRAMLLLRIACVLVYSNSYSKHFSLLILIKKKALSLH